MSSDLSAFQRIKSLTKDALAAFEKREVTLKELSINEVYPVIEDITNRLMSGPATEYLFFLVFSRSTERLDPEVGQSIFNPFSIPSENRLKNGLALLFDDYFIVIEKLEKH
jgi:hypothetical protein